MQTRYPWVVAFLPRRLLALCSADDPQIGSPGTDFVGILPREDSRDLHQVIEVVSHPCRQQLAQRHDAQLGMAPAPVEIRRRQTESRQLAKACLAERREFVEQARERASL